MAVRDLTYVGDGLIPAPLHGPAKRYEPLPPGDVTDIAIHHMTGWNPPPDATPEQEIRFLQGIDEYHRSSRGLDGIGYHIVPMASGRVYIVSRLDRYGAHVGYENDHLLGLALPGDYTSELPAPGHLVAAVWAVRFVYGYLGRNVPTTPHLAWFGTTCPGARWREWVPQLREQALKEESMPSEHDQHHQQLADRMQATEEWLSRIQSWLEAHDNTAHEAMNARLEAVEERSGDGGDGIKRGETVTIKGPLT